MGSQSSSGRRPRGPWETGLPTVRSGQRQGHAGPGRRRPSGPLSRRPQASCGCGASERDLHFPFPAYTVWKQSHNSECELLSGCSFYRNVLFKKKNRIKSLFRASCGESSRGGCCRRGTQAGVWRVRLGRTGSVGSCFSQWHGLSRLVVFYAF